MPDEAPQIDEAARRLALRHVERLVEWSRRDNLVEGCRGDPRPVRSAGIVGAGLMGTAIAAAGVKCGLPVVITDVSPEALAAAPGRIADELTEQGAGGPGAATESVRRLVRASADMADVGRCDLVLESVAETVPAKHEVYARLAPHLGPTSVLASNTSTIPIATLAAGVAEPRRFCGIHFFHPVRERSLVEIVRGPATEDGTLASAVSFAKRLGKMPLLVADGPGFLVNRLLQPYLGEALEMLLEGAGVEEIDAAAIRFGMAMGPFRILDEIGLDVALHAGMVLGAAFPERVAASPLLVAMVKAGLLGRKTGAGFFRYSDRTAWKGPGRPNPRVEEIVARWARPPRPLTSQEIADRLLLLMVLEGCRVIEEQVVRDPRDVDLAVVFGLGFPADRGGLLYWADQLGPERLVERLGELQALGERARPTAGLLEMARSGRYFYGEIGPEGGVHSGPPRGP